MTAPGRTPRLKSPTGTAGRIRHAEPARTPAAGGAPKVVAEGVLSSLGPDPQVVTVTGIMPGLQLRMTGVPVADWLCRCGHHERARGKTAVRELTARVRVGNCPHQTTTATAERSQAA